MIYDILCVNVFVWRKIILFNLSLTACSFLLKKTHSRNTYYNLNDKIEINNENNVENISVQDIFDNFF